MIKQFLLFSIAIMIATGAKAQTYTFGIDVAMLQSTQLYKNPQRPDEGTTQHNWYTGWSVGPSLRIDSLFKSHWLRNVSLKARAVYARRGFLLPAQTVNMPVGQLPGATGVVTYNDQTLVNKLNYVCLDISAQQKLIAFDKFSVLGEVGIGGNYLINSRIEAGSVEPVKLSPPYDTYNNATVRSINASLILGLQLRVAGVCNLYVQNNLGITPVYRDASNKVKDWSWAFGANVDLLTLKSKSAKK